ncbi:MAG: DNA-directed RNA polymerase subunit omega [Planctomycetaceae bacterium]|jgi:DNA-directed RNA polymerase subunit omega|nr:DNA-directed RNA polymerase subunit omega [Planctomycetaceae bacterium]
MIEELKDEELIRRVKGRFKLSTLIQKRLVYLNKGARAFVDTDKKDKLSIVIQEIIEDKIYLDMEGNLQTRHPNGFDAGILDSDFSDGQ